MVHEHAESANIGGECTGNVTLPSFRRWARCSRTVSILLDLLAVLVSSILQAILAAHCAHRVHAVSLEGSGTSSRVYSRAALHGAQCAL